MNKVVILLISYRKMNYHQSIVELASKDEITTTKFSMV